MSPITSAEREAFGELANSVVNVGQLETICCEPLGLHFNDFHTLEISGQRYPNGATVTIPFSELIDHLQQVCNGPRDQLTVVNFKKHSTLVERLQKSIKCLHEYIGSLKVKNKNLFSRTRTLEKRIRTLDDRIRSLKGRNHFFEKQVIRLEAACSEAQEFNNLMHEDIHAQNESILRSFRKLKAEYKEEMEISDDLSKGIIIANNRFIIYETEIGEIRGWR